MEESALLLCAITGDASWKFDGAAYLESAISLCLLYACGGACADSSSNDHLRHRLLRLSFCLEGVCP